MVIGSIQHEALHMLGFLHMHTTTQRDAYVDIQWNHVVNSAITNFNTTKFSSLYGTEYDYDSITHYSTNAFSNDGKPTIVSKTPGKDLTMGQRDHLSAGDITRLNRMYDCPDKN
ncbi:unnamed protein product [Diamesa tonsa]